PGSHGPRKPRPRPTWRPRPRRNWLLVTTGVIALWTGFYAPAAAARLPRARRVANLRPFRGSAHVTTPRTARTIWSATMIVAARRHAAGAIAVGRCANDQAMNFSCTTM